MLGACHHPCAPQSSSNSLMPPDAPSQERGPSLPPLPALPQMGPVRQTSPSASALPDACHIGVAKRGEV